MASGGIPLSEWSGSGATRELHETIKLQIASTDRQSKVIARLTVFMAILAVVQTFAAVVQIIPIIQGYQDKNATNKLSDSAGTLNKQENKPPLPKRAGVCNPGPNVFTVFELSDDS
ncbi:MAG: hypothetical protein K9L79_09570 [Methylobacter tundripaludum]|uniref:Uncharacterized protein n=1 Tax=Methylobacter tundripaludum TaxID=173365 RepID=A0A2S6GVL9_9GAMM|nr:hypothetical protein [Methylobacter tundripaludum]MCF7965771.1 hypothetical protein [Methylobacter tundripaludum]PPK69282.1 hypothetical protein B0F88_11068 [Methylobacter tundripaludum]